MMPSGIRTQLLRRIALYLAVMAVVFFPWRARPTEAQSVINITGCQTVSTAGNYRLANDIAGATGNGQSCLNIQGSNITIDGNGKTITSSGDYAIMDLADGTISQNITVTNFTSADGVSIYHDVQHWTFNDVTIGGLIVQGADYFTMTNSTINGGSAISSLGTENSTHVVFTGNTVTGNSDRLAIFSGDAHTEGNCDTTGFTINNNTFTDTFATNANNPVNVYLSCTENGSFNGNTVISTNEATGTLIRDGWSHNSFANNTIHVNTAVFDTRGAIAIVPGSLGGPPSYDTFNGNTVIADNGKALFHYMETTGNVFQNNLFVSNSTNGSSMTYTSATPGTPIQFIHNTFIERGSGAALAFANDSMTQLLLRDNIFVTNGGSIFTTNGTRTGTTINHNIYKNRNDVASFGTSSTFAAWTSAAGDTNSQEADPKFVDYANGNYHLQASSPAVGAGTGGSDIGAYPLSGGSCTESWTCGNWSACSGNTQTRTCTDANACGTIANRPVLTQSCDSTAPTVSITAPTNGATVSGSISVTATANDNVGVAGVQFKLDGNNLGSEDTTSPYSLTWNTTATSAGSHVLTAVARDAAGNTTTSAAVTITVNNAVSCVENWSCGAWSACSNNQKTRTCTDANSCGTTANRPALSQNCDSTPPAAVANLHGQ